VSPEHRFFSFSAWSLYAALDSRLNPPVRCRNKTPSPCFSSVCTVTSSIPRSLLLPSLEALVFFSCLRDRHSPHWGSLAPFGIGDLSRPSASSSVAWFGSLRRPHRCDWLCLLNVFPTPSPLKRESPRMLTTQYGLSLLFSSSP